MMPTLSQLKDKRDKLDTQICKLEAQAIRKRWGIYRGCIVTARGGKQFKVSIIDDHWGEVKTKPSLTARLIKKDGKLSNNFYHLRIEWEFVK